MVFCPNKQGFELKAIIERQKRKLSLKPKKDNWKSFLVRVVQPDEQKE